LVALGGAALLASACDDGGDRHGRHHHHQESASCSAESTCGTCTPVVGCGWCFTPDGGACVSGPDECPTDATGWTWDPPGCDGDAGDAGEDASDASEASDVMHVPAEAGVGSSDAAGD
jgi:hypothetical protein